VTLVRVMPAFCTTTEPPYPTAPEPSTAGVQAVRTAEREAARSRTAAARPKRTKVSHPDGSQSRATLDSGTVVPHSSPAVVSAATARRRSRVMQPWNPMTCTEFVGRTMKRDNIS
jgi:hypothetical protein